MEPGKSRISLIPTSITLPHSRAIGREDSFARKFHLSATLMAELINHARPILRAVPIESAKLLRAHPRIHLVAEQKMTKFVRLFLLTSATLLSLSSTLLSQTPPPASPKLKDEMRMPWQRSDENFLRLWLVAGPFLGGLDTDCLSVQAGKAATQPTDGLELKRADGTSFKWHSQKSWDDVVTFNDLQGSDDASMACAFTKVTRTTAGKALLSVGSGDGIRVWLNGALVLSKDGLRSLTPDEDQVEVDMNAGDNALLVKVAATRPFCA